MKKTLLATAITAALIGMTGCNNETTTADASGYTQQQAKMANATFSAKLPNGEATAALIDSHATEIKVKMYSLNGVLNNLYQLQQSGQFDQLPDVSWIMDQLDQYASQTSMDPQHAVAFAEGVIDTWDTQFSNVDIDSIAGDSLMIGTITSGQSSTSFTGIPTGPYLIKVAQKDADGNVISAQRMVANLGSGDNNIVATMFNGHWQVKDDNGDDSYIPFQLLGQTSGDYAFDWDPMTEGTQPFWEAFSNGDTTNNDIRMTAIDYLSDRANPFWEEVDNGSINPDPNNWGNFIDSSGNSVRPVNYFYTFQEGDDANTAKRIANFDDYMESSDYTSSVERQMKGRILQVYDQRLADQKNIAAPNMFNLNFHLKDEVNGQYQDGGAMFVTADFPINKGHVTTDTDNGQTQITGFGFDGESGQEFSQSITYHDPDGTEHTLPVMYAENYGYYITYPSDQMDIYQLKDMTTDGQTINGVMIEYVEQGQGNLYSIEGITDDSAFRPTEAPETAAGMAVAQALYAQQHGASAAAEHPLGSNCVDASQSNFWINIEYAWIDGEWKSGVVNPTYVEVPDGNGGYIISGEDLNGDRTVSRFEEGVAFNWTYHENEDGTVSSDAQDLDGDETPEKYESVAGIKQTDSESTITACYQPVHLVGSDLTIPRSEFRKTEGSSDNGGTGGTEGDANGDVTVH